MELGERELALLISVVPLAIGAAFTPSLFALQILATSGTRWLAKSLSFFAGSASAFLIACSALYFGFAQLPTVDPKDPNPTGGGILLLASLVLLGMTIWLWMPHRELAQKMEKSMTARLDKTNLATFFTLAFALSIKDVTSFALIVPALHEVAASSVPVLFQLLTAALVYVLALFPVMLPPLWRLLRGQRASDEMAVVYRFTMDHQFQILGVLSGVFCLYAGVLAFGPHGFGLWHY